MTFTFDALRAAFDAIKLSSDDPDTQTACLLFREEEDSYPAIMAANAMAPGVKKLPIRTKRPDKYIFIQHAERAAIAQAAKYGLKTDGAIMAINWFPCSDCANLIVGAGIKTLWCDQKAFRERIQDPKYQFGEAFDILNEGGVSVRWWNK